jgi:hypothetical protein
MVNKAQETETKPSKIGKSIEAKAIEAGLTKGLEGVAGYTPTTFKKQADIFSNLINTDIESARKMLRMEQELPEGGISTGLITAMEEYIKQNINEPGIIDVINDLANSQLVSGTSEAAQVLSLASQRTQDSAVSKLLEVKKYREQKAEKSTKKTKKDVVKQLKEQTEKINLSKEERS